MRNYGVHLLAAAAVAVPLGLAQAADLIVGFSQDALTLDPANHRKRETETIIREHLDLVRRHRFEEIASKTGLALEQVMASIDVLKHLDPKPGLKYSDESNHYVVPDVFVVKVDGEYQVVLNEEGMPRLRISPLYRRLLAQKETMPAETRQFVNEKFKAALWLIRSLEQRGVHFERYPGMPQDEFGVWTTPDGSSVAWFKDVDGNVLSLTQF